jgi:hypothetical protein
LHQGHHEPQTQQQPKDAQQSSHGRQPVSTQGCCAGSFPLYCQQLVAAQRESALRVS